MKHEGRSVFKMSYSIKREQIVFDWINTIEEFHCLLVSSVEDLRDGVVLVEIGKELMRKIGSGIDECLVEKMEVKERFEVVYGIINRINNDGNICRKYDLDVTDKDVDEDEALIILAEIMRNQMVMIDEFNDIKKEKEKEKKKDDDGMKEVMEEIDNENKQTDVNKKDDQRYEKRVIDRNEKEEEKELIKKADYDYKKYREDMKDLFDQKDSIEATVRQDDQRVITKETNSNKNNIAILRNNHIDKIPSVSLSHVQKNKTSNNPSPKMLMGIMKLLHSKLSTESSTIYLPYYKFYKPSSLVINMSKDHLFKYTTINQFNHSHSKEKYQRTSSPDDHHQMSNEDTLAISTNNYEINPHYNIVSDTNKTNIFLWLNDFHMIPKDISLNDIPSLCCDGLLLSDLINRNEGRFDTIKGINRVIKRESHAKANLKKVINHLRSKEKFPSRTLFSLNDIMKGNDQIIWCLLEDIWQFYSYPILRSLPSHISSQKSKSQPQLIVPSEDIIMSNTAHQPIKSQRTVYHHNMTYDHNTPQTQPKPRVSSINDTLDKSKEQMTKKQIRTNHHHYMTNSYQSVPLYTHFIANNNQASRLSMNNTTTIQNKLTKSYNTVANKPQQDNLRYVILEKNTMRKMKELLFI